jgi:hypothetical protein
MPWTPDSVNTIGDKVDGRTVYTVSLDPATPTTIGTRPVTP